MPDGSQSLQSIIARRQSRGLFGREAQLDRFAANLELPVDDPRKRFLFNVHGVGGVGKTLLLKQLRQVAQEHGMVGAGIDHRVFSAVEAMGELARQLADAGIEMKEFTRLEAVYEQRLSEIGADPEAPSGVATVMTRTAARIGQEALKSVPVVGAVAAAVEGQSLAEQAEELRRFLMTKLRPKDALLLLRPVEVLTPAFARELAAAGRKHSLALFIDTFERTSPFLNDWLLALYEGRYGPLPARLLVTIAGQQPLERSDWAPYFSILADEPLEPFEPERVREMLALRGVTDEGVVELVVRHSGGLPLLVEMLAEHRPAGTAAVGNPSSDAVNLFLKWERDPARRELALAAACPRVVNEDVLRRLRDGAGEVAREFAWLRELPFVIDNGGPCEYHPVVRAAMLRLGRGQSPRQWRARHERLRDHFREQRVELAAIGIAAEEAWRAAILDEIYHELCANPAAVLDGALAAMAHTLFGGEESFTAAVRMMVQAGEDSGSETVGGWGTRLSEAMRGPEGPIAVLGLLIRDAHLPPEPMASAYGERGRRHAERSRFAQALADYTRALEYQPDLGWVLGRRAVLYRGAGRFEEAIADLDRHLELAPDATYVYGLRAASYRQSEQFEKALEDYERALGFEPGNGVYHGERGLTYLALERRADGLADLTRAADLISEPSLAAVYRSMAHLLGGRFEEAVAEADRALATAPGTVPALLVRGSANRLLGNYRAALPDLDRVLQAVPRDASALGTRGQAHLALGDGELATADLARSLAIKPDEPACRLAAASAARSLGDEAQAAQHLAAGVAALERKGPAAHKGALAVFRLAQGDHAAARRLLTDFLAKPAELVERRVLELSLNELAQIPGNDRALIHELLAQVRGS